MTKLEILLEYFYIIRANFRICENNFFTAFRK